jgi:type II secretory pathway pseudopilin PulG
MKISFPQMLCRRAFTLVELMFAVVIGLGVAGSIVFLMFQSAQEQSRGLAATAVEEHAYILQAKISAVLRGASGNQGITPDYGTAVYAGVTLLGYQSIIVFAPTNGAYVSGRMAFTPDSGQIVYIPNLATGTPQLWLTNSANLRLTNLLFSTSLNLDGSPNSSLINVQFEMDDNGVSRQSATNNLASVFRTFSIQMRND